MRRIEFLPDELIEIGRDRYEHADPAVRRRMEALWLKAKGEKHERVAELAGCSRPTVQRLLDTYLAGGLSAVRTYHWKAPVGALAPHRDLLAAEFDERPPHTTAEACERIEKLTGVRRSESRVREFMRDELGLGWRKTGAVPLPPKLSLPEHAAKQAAFLKDGA
jgi:transposase